MKAFLFGSLLVLFLFLLLFVWLHAIGRVPRHYASAPDTAYLDGLESSQQAAVAPPSPAEGAAWLERIQTCFGVFSVDNLEQTVDGTYAETFYFRDAFHVFTDRAALKDYMILSARTSPGVTFSYGTPFWNGVDAYLPWTMQLPPRKDGEAGQHSMGLTHLRYNDQGQVIFHHDYWDSADVLVPRVPVANGLIELVRRRF